MGKSKKNRLIREIRTLRSWADHRSDGSTIPGEAFGMGCRVDFGFWLPASLKARDYDYTITCTPDGVELVIDTYTAINGPFTAETFDVDAWSDGYLTIMAKPASRSAYEMQHQIARLLLSGRAVTLEGAGVTLLGLKNVNAAEAV